MQNDRWEQFIKLAQDQFQNVDISTEDLIYQGEDGPEKQGTVDVLEFEHPNGERYRLERENKPLVLEKKTHYAKRATDTAQTEYVLSDSEFTHKLRVYKENMSGDWEEVTPSDLGLE